MKLSINTQSLKNGGIYKVSGQCQHYEKYELVFFLLPLNDVLMVQSKRSLSTILRFQVLNTAANTQNVCVCCLCDCKFAIIIYWMIAIRRFQSCQY